MRYNENAMILAEFNKLMLLRQRVQLKLHLVHGRDDPACRQDAFCLGNTELCQSNRPSFTAVDQAFQYSPSSLVFLGLVDILLAFHYRSVSANFKRCAESQSGRLVELEGCINETHLPACG